MANNQTTQSCAKKVKHLQAERPCLPSGPEPAPIDLIVLADTSDSMQDDMCGEDNLARAVRKSIDDALRDAQQVGFPPDMLRVCWLGIEGSWPQTDFAQSVRHYLRDRGVNELDLRGRLRDTVPHQGAQEDGARAIIDLAYHFDWRPRATRLLLYLGDEPLEGGLPHDAADRSLMDEAIAAAQMCDLHIYTYAGTGPDKKYPDANVKRAFAKLSWATGGDAYVTPTYHLRRFYVALYRMMEKAVSTPSQAFDTSNIRPCFTLKWGDHPTDRLETDHAESLLLVASNPYRNVLFQDVTITAMTVTNANRVPLSAGRAETAVSFAPHLIQFGDLPPAQSDQPGQVVRELMLTTTGAASGRYRFTIQYHFHATFTPMEEDRFLFHLEES